jgi:hypothetical protein
LAIPITPINCISTIPFHLRIRTYRKRGEHRRYQSSWTPRYHPCRGRQCQRGRREYAIHIDPPVSALILLQNKGPRSTYAQNALSTDQLHQLVLHGTSGIALGISLEVAQVTDVALRIGGSTMGLGEGVD